MLWELEEGLLAGERRIGFLEAFSIGVGGMVGGGIFAVLGLTLELAGGAAPVAFLLAGLVALTTAYSYAKLSVRFPSSGGTVEFLVRGFGRGFLSGWLNTLLLSSYIVMLALYSYAFGSYAAGMLAGGSPQVRGLFVVVVMAFFVFVNALGAYVSGKAEDAMVFFKVGVLLLVGLAGLGVVDVSRLSPQHWPPLLSILVGGLTIFLAYEGFELIATTGGDVEEPEKTLPRAFYASVVFVILLYVLVATVAAGTLTAEEVARYRDYALAVAARPALGELGFALIGVAALVSTASAINATLYGTARISYMIARYGELPRALGRRIWRGAYEGLLVIAFLGGLAALTLPLEEISLAGSIGFLAVFASVNIVNARLSRYTGARRSIALMGAAACLASIVVLVAGNLGRPVSLAAAAILLAGSALAEAAYRAATGRAMPRYVDWRLEERERILAEWERHAKRFAEEVARELRDAEVYLVGSLARGEHERAHDIDILVVTEAVEKVREAARRAAERLGLPPHHPIHVHSTTPSEKQRWLEKSRAYKLLHRPAKEEKQE